jgi:ERCC4-related helicase
MADSGRRVLNIGTIRRHGLDDRERMTGYTEHHGTYLATRIMLEGRSEDAFAKNLSTARVETKPHQVDAALFGLHSPLSKGIILADEVGLGKTIEASLIIAQHWAERRRHILLVVPASLRKQWQQELREKFSLPSVILEARTYRAGIKAGRPRPFDQQTAIVLTSYEFAARRADDLRLIAWDLVVFDEAHRLRNVYKPSGSVRAKALRDAIKDRFKILLTATPLQNSLMELYGLVSVIDDKFFGDEKTFKTMYEGRRADALTLTSLRRRMAPIYKRHLRRDVQEAGHVAFTRRIATTFDFEPSDRETELYDSVSRYLQRPDSIAFGLKPNQLVIIQARKILGSSVAAIAGFLQTILDRLRRNQVADLSTVADADNTDEVAEELDEDEADDGESDDHAIDPKKLAAEIAEVEAYLRLAREIGSSAKGEKLLARLPEVLDEVEKRGGQRKIVIFTESVRTQTYLASVLSEHGYAGQIVLMNGSNSDPESQAICKAWQEKHKGTDAISGSRSADMKAAVVDAFRGDDRTILIATESGAEGINLQFCSLLLNFDLPWNPQRVEQRIGRCHRYGQKIDVTVVNMLNRRNRAEQRVYQLLDQKFRLFSGVFGASDDVLGAIESGIDFERKVVEAVQRGRTDVEIEAEFKQLEDELEAQITNDMREARQKLFDFLDRDVVARLRQRGSEIEVTLNAFEQRLLTVARAELPAANFHTSTGPRFDYDGRTWTTEWPLADERGWQFFRLAEDTLAEKIVAAARSRQLQPASLSFDYGAYRRAGWPRLGKVERLTGRSGWLTISVLTVTPADAALGQRDRLVVAGFSDGLYDDVAEHLDQETVDDLFLLPGGCSDLPGPFPAERLAPLEQTARSAVGADVEAENRRWLDEETEKLDAYADDIEVAADTQIKQMETEIRAAKKALRGNAAITLEDKVKEQRRIKALEAQADELKLSTFQRRKAVRAEMDDRLDAIAQALKAVPIITPLITLRWSVAA